MSSLATPVLVAFLCSHLNTNQPQNNYDQCRGDPATCRIDIGGPCRKAMTMGVEQIGLDKNFKEIEAPAEREAYSLLGERGAYFLVSAGELAATHRIILSFKIPPIADSIGISASTKNTFIGLNWILF